MTERRKRRGIGETLALRFTALPVVAIGGVALIVWLARRGFVIGAIGLLALTFALLVILYQGNERKIRPVMWVLRPVKRAWKQLMTAPEMLSLR